MIPPEALDELKRLNDNLETLHKDAEDFKGLGRDLRDLSATLKGMKDRFKSFPVLAKQIAILNQIMLQTKRAAGTAGMLQTLFSGILEAAAGRRRPG